MVWSSVINGGIRPSFSLQSCSWNATDIVLATEGEVIDGKFQVLEVWKGTLKIGNKISVPELAAFAPKTNRTVSSGRRYNDWSGFKLEGSAVVSGAKMVLFLKRGPEKPETWQSASIDNDLSVSVVWIEQHQTYAIRQIENPGPSVLTELRQSEAELKKEVNGLIQTQNSLLKAASMENPSNRAQSLRPFLQSPNLYARRSAFAELSKSGQAALPILREMLIDKTLSSQHAEVVEAFGNEGGMAVGKELSDLLETETLFWRQIAPKLTPDWWSKGVVVKGGEVISLHHRYSKLLSTLVALKKMKYPGCKAAVMQLREFWKAELSPAADGNYNQVIDECDKVLKLIN